MPIGSPRVSKPQGTVIAGSLANGNKIIVKERLAAAFAAQFELSDLVRLAQDLPLLKVATHSAKKMFDAIDARGGDPANFLSREWKRTLPALHMAVALNYQIEGEKISFDTIIYDEEYCFALIRASNWWRPIVRSHFGIKSQFPPFIFDNMSKKVTASEIPMSADR
jgi:hypothetical protein